MKKNTIFASEVYGDGGLEQSINVDSNDEKSISSTENISQTTPKRTRNENMHEAPKKTIDRDVITLEHNMRSLWTGPPESKRRLDLDQVAEDDDNKKEGLVINSMKEMGI